MVLICTAMFEISWIADIIVHLTLKKNVSDGISIAHTLMMFNSAVNPLVYALFSQKFRQKMKGMLYRRSCLFRGGLGPAETSLSARDLSQPTTSAPVESLPASEKNLGEVFRLSEIS